MSIRRRPGSRGIHPFEELCLVLTLSFLMGSFFAGCGTSGEGGQDPLAKKVTGALKGAVEGRVLDATTGRQLVGVLVSLDVGDASPHRTLSLVDGSYRFEDIRAGQAELQTFSSTHFERRISVQVPKGSTEVRNLMLSPRDSRADLTLQVLDSFDAQPLSGVEVTIPDLGIRGLTNGLGQVLLPQLPARDHQLEIQLPGYQPESLRVFLVPGEDRTARIELERKNGTVFGVVTSQPSSRPLTSVFVSVPGSSVSTLTGSDGSYSLPGVPSGSSVGLLFSEVSHSPRLVTTGVPPSGLVQLDVDLFFGTGVLEGQVRDAITNLPVGGVEVSLPSTKLSTRTDAAGQYRFDAVPAGVAIPLGVLSQTYVPATTLITIPGEGFVVQDFDLISSVGSISGAILRQSDGTPVSGASISVPTQGRTTVSDVGGGFFLSGLATEFLRFDVTAVGLSPRTTFLEILAGQTVLENIILSEITTTSPASLSGRVRSQAGLAPVTGALVVLSQAGRFARTNATGEYSFSGLTPQVGLSVSVLAAQFQNQTTSVTLTSGQMLTQDFEIVPLN